MINNINLSLPLHYYKGSCYVNLDRQDLKRLNLNSDEGSCYIAKQVYNYVCRSNEYYVYKYINSYLKFRDGSYEQIKFEDNNSPKYTIVITKEDQSLRVKNTKNKLDYWKNQLQLITHCSNDIKSVVYVIENECEVKIVQDLIQENQSKLDCLLTSNNDLNTFIAETDNKTIFITYIDKFIDNLDKFNNSNKLCFIFDSILYDLYKIIYSQDNELKLINNIIENNFSLYFNKIFNNNASSEIYIIDPIFEEIVDLEDEFTNNSYGFLKNIEVVKLRTSLDISIDIGTKDYFNHVNAIHLDICNFAKKYFLQGKKLHDKQQLYLPIILNASKNLVINLPTGFGKSVLFQSCALYKFFENNSLTVVISPLNALMQDQVESLNKYSYFRGLVDYINSSKTKAQINRLYRKIINKELAILYVSPERFMVKSFYELIFNNLDIRLAYIVFDEAHCIFQWSNDFRPDYYLALEKTLLLHNLTNAKLLFLSATLTAKMQEELFYKVSDTIDINEIAYDNKESGIYDYVESNIDKLCTKMQLFVKNKTIKATDTNNDLDTFIDDLNLLDDFSDIDVNYSREIRSVIELFDSNEINIDIAKSNIIIFCKTVYQAKALKEILNNRAHRDKNLGKDTIFAKLCDRVDCFYAALTSSRKEDIYNRYKNSNKDNGINVLCATKAFGMGIDIPNIHIVIHLVPPNNIEDFLQEIGRAGRDIKSLAEFNNGKIIAFINKNSDDFETHKNQLNSSKISWQDLETLRKIIVDYKKEYYENSNNIFLPHNICCISKDEYFYDAIKTKLRLYWLHRMNYLSIKNYEYNYLLISIEKNIDIDDDNRKSEFEILIKNTINIGKVALINISTFAQNLCTSFRSCIDRLIYLQKNKYIKILNIIKIDARAFNFKNNEKELLFIKSRKNVLSFHILFNSCKELLESHKKTQVINMNDIEELELINKQTYTNLGLLKELDGVEYIYLNNKDTSIKYLSFEKRVNSYIRYCIIDLLKLIPNLDFQQQDKDNKLYNFNYSNACILYLDKIQNCCLEIINQLVDNNYLLDLNWSSFIIDNDFDSVLLESSLFILQKIGLIANYSSLYDFGYSITIKDSIYNEIKEEYKEGESLYKIKTYFDDFYKTKLLRIFAMDSFIANYNNSNMCKYQLNEINHNLLHDYLLAKSSDDYIDIILKYNKHSYGDLASYISQEALAHEKDKIRNNYEQYIIYNLDKTQSINVLAGPGSGKTYMLVLRCAKLIIEEGIDPSKMLILAYNRSVVMELKRRLHEMFSKLGFNTLSRRLRVFTFHGLIKFCLQDELATLTFEKWSIEFLNKIKYEGLFFTNKFRELEYIFIDEFQDINQERLDCIKAICSLYHDIKLFTIGDMNQSIYGYERVNDDMCGTDYKRLIDPRYYYDQLSDFIEQKQLHLSTNYRSFKKIIDFSTQFFTCDKKELVPCQKLIDTEPKTSYINIVSVKDNNILQWKTDLLNYLESLPIFDKYNDDQIKTVAVLCRTNDEVFYAYSQLKGLVPNGVKIRIQGASSFEFWRDCCFYDFIEDIQERENKLLDNKGLEYIKNFCKKMILQAKVNKDSIIFNMNLAYILSVYFVQTKESKDIYYRDLCKFLTDEMESDSNFIYEMYYKYREYHIVPENCIMLILSTIHKVKGLEFDAVFIPQSSASLPLKNADISSKSKIEADLEEEKRLRYVAITRAKKYLSVYIHSREQALINNETFVKKKDRDVIVHEKGDSLTNYYINFCLLGKNQNDFFQKMYYICGNIEYGDPVKLYKERGFVRICHNDYPVASFSSNKDKNLIIDNIKNLGNEYKTTCFVKGIYVWRYEDALKSDKKKNTSYANNFKLDGYIAPYVYVVCVYIQSEKEKNR